jgi:hypothetical protein
MQNIDWDCIEIEKRWIEEGPRHVYEKGVYEKMRFKHEDEERKAKEEVVDTGAQASQPTDDGDDDIVLCSRPMS